MFASPNNNWSLVLISLWTLVMVDVADWTKEPPRHSFLNILVCSSLCSQTIASRWHISARASSYHVRMTGRVSRNFGYRHICWHNHLWDSDFLVFISIAKNRNRRNSCAMRVLLGRNFSTRCVIILISMFPSAKICILFACSRCKYCPMFASQFSGLLSLSRCFITAWEGGGG